MKKVMYFVVCLSLLLLVPYNRVYADDYPSRFVQLNYFDYEFAQENELTYEYIVTYLISHKISEPISVSDYFLFYRYDFFNRGLDRNKNSYRLDSYVIEPGYSELHFRVTVTKDLAHSRYPSGDLTYLFSSHSVMYIKSDYVEPEKVMKLFLSAELSGEPAEYVAFGEPWHKYFDIYVYLPDGSKVHLKDVGGMIRSGDSVFDGYDFVAFYFNLSPRAWFWTTIFEDYTDEVQGLSYIVYDITGFYTLMYDFNGQEVHRYWGIKDITFPSVRMPASDDLLYRERGAYEQGKSDGIKLGKEQGYSEGYEKGYDVGYIQGKNEAHFENLDLFSYLEALFGDKGLGRLLKIELLPGVSLGAVIMIPLAFWLVSFIMRWFR